MTTTPDTAQTERLVEDFGNAVKEDCCWYSQHRDSDPQRTALIDAIRETLAELTDLRASHASLVRERDELYEECDYWVQRYIDSVKELNEYDSEVTALKSENAELRERLAGAEK